MRAITLLTFTVILSACTGESQSDSAGAAADDSAFAALQERGAAPQGMGVDQYASVHVFDDLPDGGRIQFQDTVGDDAAVEQIRAHLQEILVAFEQGDFSTPAFVHGVEEVPGTRVMADRRGVIEYEYAPLERGGAVTMRTSDAEALRAIHDFLAFQRMDHRAGGHPMH